MISAIEVEAGHVVGGVLAVSGADGDGQAVAAGALDELDGHVHVGVHVVGTAITLGGLADVAELGLDRGAVGVGKSHDLLDAANILFEGQAGGVAHDAREAGLDAAADVLELRAVVEVKRHGDVQGLCDGLDHGGPDLRGGVHLELTGRQVQDDRGLLCLGCHAGGLDHVVAGAVRSGNRVVVDACVLENFLH